MKTPILRPPVEAILFGFERIGMVIRIAWFPIVLVIAAYIGVVGAYGGEALTDIDWTSGDPEKALEDVFFSGDFVMMQLLLSMAMPLLASLLLSCVYVALTRASTLAAYEPPSFPIYFALGSRELKYFIVRLLYAILIGVVGTILALTGAAVIGVVAAIADPIEGQLQALVVAPGVAIALMLGLAWFWVALRFLPALPIAAVENRIDFLAAWKMTKGNFWRLVTSGLFFFGLLYGAAFVMMILIFIPTTIILAIAGGILYSVMGAAGFAIFALLALLAIIAFIVVGSFMLAAESAFPARIYAYLSGCGEDCKIY